MQDAIVGEVRRPMMVTRKGAFKFYAGGVIILVVIAYVTLTSFQANSVYYYTVQEVAVQHAKLAGQNLRVNGSLDKASLQLDQKTMTLRFNLQDGKNILPVVYRGVVPDTLTTSESVVAEGHLDTQGIFQADTILVKCPSKYEESKP